MHCTIYVGLVVVVVTDTLISLHLFIQIASHDCVTPHMTPVIVGYLT